MYKTLAVLLVASVVSGAIGFQGSDINGPECGKSNVDSDAPRLRSRHHRIVGGRNAEPGKWPWMVGIRHTNGLLFGGTIINENFVLTTDMFAGYPSVGFHIVAGEHNRSSVNSKWIQAIGVEKSIRFEPEIEKGFVPNICLMKLARPLVFNERVRPVCLPSKSDELKLGTPAITLGWGFTSTGRNALMLQETTLPIADTSECKKYLSEVFDEKQVICAGVESGNTRRSFSDEGAPLLIKRNDRWYQDGLTIDGEWETDYDVSLKVSAYVDWIKEQIRNNSQ